MSDIKWIGQEDSNGCSLAALAMVLGKTYREVRSDWLHFENRGISFFEYDRYLAEKGYAVARIYKHSHASKNDLKQWPIEPFADIHICTVKISDDSSVHHTVVMLRDGTILDPLTPSPRALSDYVRVDNIAGIVPINK